MPATANIKAAKPRPIAIASEKRSEFLPDIPTVSEGGYQGYTSQSWYGAAGALVILGGIAAAVVGVRRGELRPSALLLAIAPLILIATFAVTILYDPWRGRLLMFAVGLACAAWGWTIRVRWLSAGTAAWCICAATVASPRSRVLPPSPIQRATTWPR